MNTGKYIFAQLIEFLPQRIFDRIVMKYEGNKYVKHFTCWNQLLVMMFGQLSNRDFVFLPKCCCYFGISITILQPS